MIDLGVHILDLALGLTGYHRPIVLANTHDFMGKPVKRAERGSRWDPTTFEVEDACFAYLSFPGNCKH